jgi:hypothetical protein
MPGVRAYRRRLIFLLAALAAVLLSSLAPAAASAAKKIPGDNGDVKIHAVGTSFLDHRNVPHVCRFYLDAFGFDSGQQVTWHIDQQPPTGHALVASGSLTLPNGKGTSAVMSLPAGHYKLVWQFNGEHGAAKHKVFWSDCAAVASPSPGSTGMTGGGTPIGSVNGSGGSGKAVAPNGSVASLAATGVTLTPWLASGVGLLLAGGWLTRRTRGRRMH